MTPIADIPQDVRDLYKDTVLQLIELGYTRYSSDAILHRIRWHFKVERGEREFKCNDHWTSALSRWFISIYPEHEKFFEFRSCPTAC